ncbi:hypothetical protein NUSPORA_03030 [Nucleospora cyclopteri]
MHFKNYKYQNFLQKQLFMYFTFLIFTTFNNSYLLLMYHKTQKNVIDFFNQLKHYIAYIC